MGDSPAAQKPAPAGRRDSLNDMLNMVSVAETTANENAVQLEESMRKTKEMEHKMEKQRRHSRELEQEVFGMHLKDVESLRKKFDEIDTDGGGTIDSTELRVALDALLSEEPPVAHVNVPPALRAAIPRLHSHSGPPSTNIWAVNSLPPLDLRLRLPATYPSRAAPVFGVRCAWLSDGQLAALCARLDTLCTDLAGAPIICEIVQWLSNEAIASVLGSSCLWEGRTRGMPRQPSEEGLMGGASGSCELQGTAGTLVAAKTLGRC